MNQCPIHAIAFGPQPKGATASHVRTLNDKPADVVDLTCEQCGYKIFLYYRSANGGGATVENQEEGEPK